MILKNMLGKLGMAAVAGLAMLGATGCGGGSSSNRPCWNHDGRSGYYIVVVSCSSYSSLACYCDATGCWYDDSGWYDVGGGYYTGYWPIYNGGNTGNSGGYYGGNSGGSSGSGNSGNSGGYYGGNSGGNSGGYYGGNSGGSSSSGNSGNSGGYYGGNSGGSSNTGSSGNSGNSGDYTPPGSSFAGNTKDTDLQTATLQGQELAASAQNIANQFHMNMDAATQLAQLSDRYQKLNATGKMTDADRVAIIDQTLSVAGMDAQKVNDAIKARVVDNNTRALDDLLEQGAKNIGMSDATAIRDQILPSLGLKF